MPGKSNEPFAMAGVIAPIATAIRAGGQQGEPIRLTLDVYEEEEVVRRLTELRGKELIIVIQEKP